MAGRQKSPESLDARILAALRRRGRGCVVVPSDFLDLGNRRAIDVALHRLVRAGSIRRLARGVYDYPKEHPRPPAARRRVCRQHPRPDGAGAGEGGVSHRWPQSHRHRRRHDDPTAAYDSAQHGTLRKAKRSSHSGVSRTWPRSRDARTACPSEANAPCCGTAKASR